MSPTPPLTMPVSYAPTPTPTPDPRPLGMSVAEAVRHTLNGRTPGCFVHAAELTSRIDGAPGAVEAELSRLYRAGCLHRCRKGLYWLATPSCSEPDPLLAGFEVVGAGAGPAELCAAQWLGLTPGVAEPAVVAAPGRAPASFSGVRFTARGFHRRELELTPTEVSLVEALRDFDGTQAFTWHQLVAAAYEAAAVDRVNLVRVGACVAREHHLVVRTNWSQLIDSLDL